MKPEEQQITILEALGWKIPDHCRTKLFMAGASPRKVDYAPSDFGQDPNGEWHNALPIIDLNFMHEAEIALSDDEFAVYAMDLQAVYLERTEGRSSIGALSATASERLDAFLHAKRLVKPTPSVDASQSSPQTSPQT